jgi:mannose/fructose/N-acetylgalactosamine-specific phosphotransferase system component IID
MCLTALFFGASVFATNLPALADFIAVSTTWSGIVTVPILMVAYVVGLLAIALVEGVTRGGAVELEALQGLAAQRFTQLEQEAEILSGSVIGFLLLAAAAFLNVWAFPGWARTLSICGAAFVVTAVAAWRVSREKHQAAAILARRKQEERA